MSRATVIEPAGNWIELRQKETCERTQVCHQAKIGIDAAENLFGHGTARCVAAHKSGHVRGPHSRSQALSTDVAERHDDVAILFFDREEISRQMTHGENLAGNLEICEVHEPRRAQTAMDLRCFENRRMQFCVISLQLSEFQFEFLTESRTRKGVMCARIERGLYCQSVVNGLSHSCDSDLRSAALPLDVRKGFAF